MDFFSLFVSPYFTGLNEVSIVSGIVSKITALFCGITFGNLIEGILRLQIGVESI